MIQVDGLSKFYGDHAAVRDLSFTIKKGEVIGFLGLNGSGKTTTLKILGCVLLPTCGRVTIEGYDVVTHPHEIRQRIGYLPDTPPVYDDMTVGGFLRFVARLRGVGTDQVEARVKDVAQQLEIESVEDQAIGTLSHGYRQRVGLAQAMVHKPELLILDEPTGGLDPRQIAEMRNTIRSLRGKHTILLSSHILPEISQICDRFIIVDKGRIVAQSTEAELAQQISGATTPISLEVEGSAAKVTEVVKGVSGVTSATVTRDLGGVVSLSVEAPPNVRPSLARALVQADLGLLRIDRTVGLESIFLQLTKGKAAQS